jgi:hypothetical protein
MGRLVTVHARAPLSEKDLDKIRKIVWESNWPGRDLRKEFPDRYIGCGGGATIHFDFWYEKNFVYKLTPP